ncbi:MAG TPA: aminotransferase class III-fold pyridoxal phosphate-dependent enzyme, partial [Nitrospira sp.]|nr:aminotransferase class III-fold pyridoxal phosphate-dependent enzyme [Nitrospira sp.]
MRFDESNRLRDRAKRLIPGGAHTYSKGDDQFPQLSPGFITHAKGSLAWDPDGNEFLDWGMGLRSVCLGHAYEPVLDVVRTQLEKGVNFTRPSLLEADLAELLVDIVPSAEMVKFAKNGSDVTTAAVRLARAYTGRDRIIRCQDHPFFSVDDWFIGDTAMDAGIPQSSKDLTLNFPFNDATALERLLDTHKGQIACIILEAAATAAPAPGFLERVRALSTQHGVVLIFDEIISGFRWHLRGAQHFYGVTPDLITFAKGVTSGYVPLGGVIVSGQIYDTFAHRPYPGGLTYSGHPLAAAAAVATIETMRAEGIVENAARLGKDVLGPGLSALVDKHACVGEVRGLGAFWAVELVTDKVTREPLAPYGSSSPAMGEVLAALKKGGVLPFANFNRIHLVPPCNISDDDARDAISALDEALSV